MPVQVIQHMNTGTLVREQGIANTQYQCVNITCHQMRTSRLEVDLYRSETAGLLIHINSP
jgi:hypothetical protein